MKRVTRSKGSLSFCSTCFWLHDTLRKESAESVAELRDRREAVLARVANLLIRSGVDDAPRLISQLSKLR